MTKPWDDVREEIVQLIKDGASLDQVRVRLSKDRKFDASIRSYRKKLKQWKLTRVGQFEIQKTSSTSASDKTGSAPTISLTSELGVAATDYAPWVSRADATSGFRSISGSSLSAPEPYPSPNSAVSPSMRALSPIPRHSLAPSDGIPPPSALMFPESGQTSSTDLESAFKDLENAANGPEMFDKLTRLEPHIRERTDTILHYAVLQQNFWVVDCILDFMLSKKMDVDIVNNNGLTALEEAIVNGHKENVESLLRANADIHRFHPEAGQPLHRACSSSLSAEICRVLLFHHASVNELQHDNGSKGPTPLRILIGRVLGLPRGPEKDRIAAMIEVLLEYKGRLSSGDDPYDHDGAIYNFLDRWTRWGVPDEGRHSRGFYLGHYFRANCNPLCWFPARHCAECHSMASFVFSHTRSHLGHLLIESTTDMVRFGSSLAQRIYKPCPNRIKEGPDSLSKLLKTLLDESAKTGGRSDWDYQLVYEVLEHSPEDEMVALLRTIVECKVRVNHDPSLTFLRLAKLDNAIRLQLAQILLEPSAGLIREETYLKLMEHYLSICNSAVDREHLDQESRLRFEIEALLAIGIRPELVNQEQRDLILPCIMHGMTRFLITNTSDLILAWQRIEAIKLRQNRGLPPLSVPTEIVKDLLRFDERRMSSRKGNAESGSSQGAAIADSPSLLADSSHTNGQRKRRKSIDMAEANEDAVAED